MVLELHAAQSVAPAPLVWYQGVPCWWNFGVMERAAKTLEWLPKVGVLLDIALERLSLGRAWMMQARNREAGKEREEAWDRAKAFLDRAVTGLREAGTQHELPRGLLARAAYYRWQGDFSNAWADLTEAREIAEFGSMGLHLCDYHLEAGRLCRDEGKEAEAEEHFKKAAEMIEKMGYHRKGVEG